MGGRIKDQPRGERGPHRREKIGDAEKKIYFRLFYRPANGLGAKDAGAVAKKIEGIGEGMNGQPLPQDQAIICSTASPISRSVG